MAFSKKPQTQGKVETNVNVLAELVEYQTAAVVSRTIAEKPGGTITLFAFDKGQGLSEHTAPFDALVYIIDGKTRITISGQPYELESGQTITMPANHPHSLQATDKFKMLLVMLKS
jgi:quercetin dioxygenase-like cupin family protein